MRRAAIERRRTLRVWHGHLAWVHSGEDEIHCVCELQPGRFRKGQRVGGCGRARCQICHYSKVHGFRRLIVHRADVSYREWLDDLGMNRPWRRSRGR